MLKIYTASKLSYAPLWRRLRTEWSEIEIVARWPFFHTDENGGPSWPSDCPAHGSVFWAHDFEDISRSDVVLVYGEKDGKLRGALVEAGMGIALGKTVIVVGEHDDYGTWKFHSAVKRVDTLEAARSLLRLIASA